MSDKLTKKELKTIKTKVLSTLKKNSTDITYEILEDLPESPEIYVNPIYVRASFVNGDGVELAYIQVFNATDDNLDDLLKQMAEGLDEDRKRKNDNGQST